MISKHIDILAVGALLLAMAFFSSARHAIVLSRIGQPSRYFGLKPQNPVIIVPRVPRPPRFPLVRN